jgi:hypothetical protein
MSEDWSGSESFLQAVECHAALFSEVPPSSLPGEPGERNCDFQVVENKLPIKVGKTEEGLNVFHLPRLRPILDNLHFVIRHSQALIEEDISEEFDGIFVPFTFFSFCKQPVFLEVTE